MRDTTSPSRGLLLDLLQRGLAAVHGRATVRDWLADHHAPGPFHLIALGKAAAAMTAGALDAAGEDLQSGLVITRYGYLDEPVYTDPRLMCLEAGHPVPDAQSLAAGNALQLFLEQTPRDARLLFLISGGTSSLVEASVAGVTPDELRRLNRWLLGSGLAISEINRVRAAVSRIKGGRLAKQLHGRPATQLLISDVPGDVISDIGSGLLVPSPPKPLPELPAEFTALPFQSGTVVESSDVKSFVIASNRHARAAVVEAAQASGHAVQDHGPFPVADAVACGESIARELLASSPGIHVWGGESTVRLPPDPGVGGRNQHLALAAARILAGHPDTFLLAAATDGSDGSDDAGALVDGASLVRGRDAGYDAGLCLKRAAAAEFLEGSGDLVDTGPTGTNVMDLVIAFKDSTRRA
jgi:hydroxypyruvate reductase